MTLRSLASHNNKLPLANFFRPLRRVISYLQPFRDGTAAKISVYKEVGVPVCRKPTRKLCLIKL